MKKIIVFAFLLICSITYGQRNQSANQRTKDSLALNAPTEIGTPDGELVSKKIGKDGGTLTSSDNKITLIFPPGAIAAETLISVQPTTNFAKESIGKAYQFEPSGIQFQKPVQLVINYTSKELDEQSPQLLGVGSQNDKGEWRGIRNTKVDTSLKTVTTNIKHFSGYALWWAILLIAEKTRIQVSHEMNLVLFQRSVEPGDEPTEELLTSSSFTNDKNWYVNGIADGNSEFGWVKQFEGAPATMTSRLYKAPAKVPDNNTVEIKVEITNNRLLDPGPNITEAFPNTIRKCHVVIYDNAYEVKMVSSMDGSAGSQLGKVIYKDEGSFVVSLDGNEPKIIEKVNMPSRLYYRGRCNITLSASGSGNIHILGAASIMVIPPRIPDGPSTVKIIFIRAPVILPMLHYDCPQPGRGRYSGSTAYATGIAMMIPAFPTIIEFLAKEEEQTILKLGEEGGNVYVKITVKRVVDD